MLELLKRLFQSAPPIQKPEEFVEFVIPDMGDNPYSMTERQKESLQRRSIPVPDNLSEKQASLLLSCTNYVRYLYEDNFNKPTNHCPPNIYLRMLPAMLAREDIRDYILKWDRYMYKTDDSEQHPFRRRKNNPLHIEISSAFFRACS